jgi:subtilisin-like proprotein convertase family protein
LAASVHDGSGHPLAAAYTATFNLTPVYLQVTGSAASGSEVNTLSSIRVTFGAAVDLSSLNVAGAGTLTGPSGNVIPITGVTAVAGSNATQVDLSFPAQTTAGNYTLTLAASVHDAVGHPLAAAYMANYSLTPTYLQVVSSVANGPNPGTVSSVRVTFSAAVDLTSLSGPGGVAVTGPTGATIPITAVVAVAGSSGTQVDLTFAAQTAAGVYTLKLTPIVRDTAGHPLAALYTTTFAIAVSSGTFVNNTPTPIPDKGIAISPIIITQSFTIKAVEVEINIQHTYDSDLYIHLVAPNGMDILLSNRNGGAGQNYVNTFFDDDGATSIRLASAPFTGTFQPESQLSNLFGMSAQGTWRLYVEDRSLGDVGTLLNWSLILNQTPSLA